MFKNILLLILFVCAAACSPASNLIPTPATNQINRRTGRLRFSPIENVPTHSYVIMADTAPAQWVDNTANTGLRSAEYARRAPETLVSFRSRNATAQTLRPDMQLGALYPVKPGRQEPDFQPKPKRLGYLLQPYRKRPASPRFRASGSMPPSTRLWSTWAPRATGWSVQAITSCL